MLKIVVRQVPLKMTPNFQRQHYLYWCNVYNLSQGNQAVFPNTTIRVLCKGKHFFNSQYPPSTFLLIHGLFCHFNKIVYLCYVFTSRLDRKRWHKV